jgi:putative SOS response-associated peptidase YedK
MGPALPRPRRPGKVWLRDGSVPLQPAAAGPPSQTSSSTGVRQVMCGRFVQYSDPDRYAAAFELGRVCAATPRYNLAPSQDILAVRLAPDRIRELTPLRWGLVPAWSKGPDPRYGMINARAETVADKPAYRNAFRHRRCLVPSEGFYEWRATPSGQRPCLVHRDDGAPFAMAGLWEIWQGASSGLQTCTIIVTVANSAVAPLHDRMPVIIDPADYALWLDRSSQDRAALTALLRPADPAGWAIHPVSQRVNNAGNEGPELIVRDTTPCPLPLLGRAKSSESENRS